MTIARTCITRREQVYTLYGGAIRLTKLHGTRDLPAPSTAVKAGMTSTSTLEYSRDNSHPPPTGRTGALILKNNIKTAGMTDRTVNPHRILGDTLKNVPEHVENHLHLLHIPSSLLSPWKVFDFGPSDTRILVLTTDSKHDFFCKSIRWWGDGNLKAAPKLWTQLYTIHGQKSGYTVPGVYALLPNKRKEMYVHLFTKMKSWRQPVLKDGRPFCQTMNKELSGRWLMCSWDWRKIMFLSPL